MKLEIKKLRNDAVIPTYATSGSAGLDLTACQNCVETISPGERKLIGTGLIVCIPEGFEGQVRPRSGRALKDGLTVLNSPGTIDSDFRGELKVMLINHSDKIIIIKHGERIAQLVINKVEQFEIEQVWEISETDRGDGGFGSTGK